MKYIGIALCVLSLASVSRATDTNVARLEIALLKRLVVWQMPSGVPVQIGHCRNAKGGCRERIHQYAEWIIRASEVWKVDPVLLAAQAVRESGVNPDAIGAMGEFGILQLNPRTVIGRRVKKACYLNPAGCTRYVIFGAAEMLSSCLNTCANMDAALGRYVSGECWQGSSYAENVLKEWERLGR